MVTDRYAELRAALPVLVEEARREGATNPRAQMIIDLLADYDRMRDAVQETVRVIESNPSSISDTVWVTGNMPETLLDRCRAALAQEGS